MVAAREKARAAAAARLAIRLAELERNKRAGISPAKAAKAAQMRSSSPVKSANPGVAKSGPKLAKRSDDVQAEELFKEEAFSPMKVFGCVLLAVFAAFFLRTFI